MNGSAAAAAAWYADPHDPSQWRWWDGTQWTGHVAPMVQQAAVPVQQVEEAAPSAHWPVPALDAPPFPVNSYSKGAFPSLRAAHRRELLAHAWQFPFVLAGAAVMVALSNGAAGWSPSDRRGVFAAEREEREDERAAQADASNLLTGWYHARAAAARDDIWSRLFRARGLSSVAVPRQPDWQEMRRVADWIRIDHLGGPPRWAAEGELHGIPGTIGELCYERRDDDGRVSRSMRMFAAFAIPTAAAARHRHVAARRRGIPLLGERVGDREVQLESTAVAKSLVIRVDDQADELATRELLGPQVVAALADYPVCWDQRGGAVVVWRASPTEPGAELDAFCAAAAAVARAYYADQR